MPTRMLKRLLGKKRIDTWEAFCTMHWFITGERIVANSKHHLTNSLYYVYIRRVDLKYADITI